MSRSRNIPNWVYELAIVASTLIWGGSYVVIKDALDHVSPGWLLGIRFLTASLIMTVLFFKHLKLHFNRDYLIAGTLIGLPGGLGFLAQNVGLTDTTPGRNAFLTATYCVMVPFVSWAVDRIRPRPASLVAALLCLSGISLLSLGADNTISSSFAGGLSMGDLLTVVGAVFFAVNVVAISTCGHQRDPITLTVIQLFICGLVCLAWGILTESPPTYSILSSQLALQFAYLIVLSTIVATLAQNVAQQHVSATRAALLFSLESVFGTAFSVLFFSEQLTGTLVVGFALILAAIFISELTPSTATK